MVQNHHRDAAGHPHWRTAEAEGGTGLSPSSRTNVRLRHVGPLRTACARSLTPVEIDAPIPGQARETLNELGPAPTVVVGDGGRGHRPRPV